MNKKINRIDLTPFYNPVIFVECVLLDNKRKLYPYQKYWLMKLYENAQNNIQNPKNAKKFYNIINKTRQCGYSTIYKYFVLYATLMLPKQDFFIFSKDNPASKKFLRDIKDIYLRIDKKKYGFLLKKFLIDNKNEIVFKEKDGTSGNSIYALSVSSGIRSMDSGRNIHVVIDEMCFIPDNALEDLLRGIEPMYSFIKEYPFSSLTFISTPLLSDSTFFKYWDKPNKNLLKIKIMWWQIEDRYLKEGITTANVIEYIKKKPNYTEEELVENFAIEWLKDLYNRDKDTFLSEYACQFLDLKGAFFDGKLVDNCINFKREYLDYTKDNLLEYAKNQFGEGILITGYDPSLGKKTSDKAVITTFYYIEESNTYYQLATKTLKMPTPNQRDFIGKHILKKYGVSNNILFLDTGGLGGAILQEFEREYGEYNVIGIYPTAKNKEIGYTNLKLSLQNSQIEFCNDIEIKRDLLMVRQEKGIVNVKFVCKRDKNMEGEVSHGDLGYAIMLNIFGIYYIKDKNIKLKCEEKPYVFTSLDLEDWI